MSKEVGPLDYQSVSSFRALAFKRLPIERVSSHALIWAFIEAADLSLVGRRHFDDLDNGIDGGGGLIFELKCEWRVC